MARRGANIYKRKDGRWEGRFTVKLFDGSTKRKSVYGHTYGETKRKMLDYKEKAPKSKTGGKNFAYYTEQWLITAKSSRKESSYIKYKKICENHLLPAFGELKIAALTTNDVTIFLEKKELAAATKSAIITVLKMICEFAENDGCLCLVRFKKIKIKSAKKETKTLDNNEQSRLMKYLESDLDNPVMLGIYLAAMTGIRIGELCALRGENFDLKNKVLHINSTLQRIQTDDPEMKTKVVITNPKSASSKRDIPLPESLVKVLEKRLNAMPEDAFFLTGKAEKFMEPNTVRYHFKRILSACGVRNVKFHALRHTFATRCIETGVDAKTVSEILGHENVKITLERYVHPSMKLKRDGIEKLCAAVLFEPSNLPSSGARTG